jgi:hypothetical protein
MANEGVMQDQDVFDFVVATKIIGDRTAGVFNPSAETDRTDLEEIGERAKAIGINFKDPMPGWPGLFWLGRIYNEKRMCSYIGDAPQDCDLVSFLEKKWDILQHHKGDINALAKEVAQVRKELMLYEAAKKEAEEKNKKMPPVYQVPEGYKLASKLNWQLNDAEGCIRALIYTLRN